MTSRERILSAIRREEVDHLPLGQLFHSTILETPKELQWCNQFERARVMKDLGLDPLVDIWMPAPEAPPEIPVRKWMEDDSNGPHKLMMLVVKSFEERPEISTLFHLLNNALRTRGVCENILLDHEGPCPPVLTERAARMLEICDQAVQENPQ